MVAAPRLGKKNNVFKPKVAGENLPGLLKVAAIYGPNASGKSSLVSAMAIPYELMKNSVVPKQLPVWPFRFDPDLADKPSNFEFNFIQQEMRYQFILSATAERIIEEKLTCYPKGKEQLLYSRTYSSSGENYTFGKILEGGDIVHNAWKQLTGPRTLFLAQAVSNSSEELKQLKKPFDWFVQTSTSIMHDGMEKWAEFAKTLLKKNGIFVQHLQKFLEDIDIPVSGIRLEEIDPASVFDPKMSLAEQHRTVLTNYKTLLTHKTALGEAEFDFDEESGGTKNLIGFWMPWVLISTAEKNGILIVDELDSSLHPKIVEGLVERHLESGNNSQLIFTTHDTHLMNTQKLRRDQFWVTERDRNGATQLFSVHDFQGRDSENIEKRYYEGRYRGLPILRG